ncbi:IS1595 family transposase [Paeniglutamicibacter gangotriensis]|nr:IS1595 family transposase [Paeniglutamicibacter gangotriensis]
MLELLLRDRRNHFRQDTDAVDTLVPCLLGIRDGEERCLSAGRAAGTGIGSYQTSWAMLHRLRQALDPPGWDLLSGTVEDDETFIGGMEPVLTGGRARGKSLVCVAVEVTPPKGAGRCPMAMIEDASARTLRHFITARVESGATVITDGWTGYLGIGSMGHVQVRRSQHAATVCGEYPGGLLPCVHRVDASGSSGGCLARIRERSSRRTLSAI